MKRSRSRLLWTVLLSALAVGCSSGAPAVHDARLSGDLARGDGPGIDTGSVAPDADGRVDAGHSDAGRSDGTMCQSELSCLAYPWTATCDGNWSCESGACAPICIQPECSTAQDCGTHPWTQSCTGHWDCAQARCSPRCDSVSCSKPEDCLALSFPLPCTGYWECLPFGICVPLCSLSVLCTEEIPFHTPVLDAGGKLLPWTSFGELIHLPMKFVASCPKSPATGLPWYMQYCSFHYQNMSPSPWPHNPAGLYAMMVETLVRYWPYTGDRTWVDFTRKTLDYLIAQSTPDSYLWPHVPYASADNSGQYHGGSHEGADGIQPDKIGQAGVGYLRFYQVTGETKYLDEARHDADVLAAKVRAGDADHSPWPFRVNARTGQIIEEYTADVVWPIVLFDELQRLGVATPQHLQARATAFSWLTTFPLVNNKWKAYFEDVEIDAANSNRDQYTPGELARYLMRHPEVDPDWKTHVPALLKWIKDSFGDTDPKWLGATGIREQNVCMELAGSHTSRYASLNAMWYAAGGGDAYREEALRSFALASYLARDDGVVPFSICDDSVWFSDGYFDYVPHFIDGMAALPEMAPANEDHLLHSSSVVTDIQYASGKVSYATFDASGEEILRLTFAPKVITAGGVPLAPRPPQGTGPGYTFDTGLNVLHIYRQSAAQVVIAGP